jgi:hypothetical protein
VEIGKERNAKNPYLGVRTFKMPHCYKHHPKSNTFSRINLRYHTFLNIMSGATLR